MSEAQLGLFAAEPAPPPEPERLQTLDEFEDAINAGEVCLLGHSAAYICPACAESGDTDGCGFLHRQVCKGRIPLRACRGCGRLKTHGTWNHADWFSCLACVPLGTKRV